MLAKVADYKQCHITGHSQAAGMTSLTRVWGRCTNLYVPLPPYLPTPLILLLRP